MSFRAAVGVTFGARALVLLVVGLLAVAAAATVAWGQVATPPFSGDGKQTTNFGDYDSATDVAVQGDGKIVVAGHTGEFSSDDFALARYNPDGTLDLSFSGDGKQTTDFGGTAGTDIDAAEAVAVQPDGKIIVAGRTNAGGTTDFALARYNENGTPDPTFSEDGRQTTDFFGREDGGRGLVLQPDGKIVVVGSSYGVGGFDRSDDFRLARYNENGTLDPTFSGDGKKITDFGAASSAADVALAPNGGIVVAGETSVRDGEFAVARYTAGGTLDPRFSGDGKQTTDFGGFDAGKDLAVQADGKIIVTGEAETGQTGFADFALARYRPGGRLDRNFSDDGRVRTDFGGNDAGQDVAVQPDGKIVVAGTEFQHGSPDAGDFALARYRPGGRLDRNFSGDGKLKTSFGSYDDAGLGLALQPDGKIVAAGFTGSFGDGWGPAVGDFAVTRYRPGGRLDAQR